MKTLLLFALLALPLAVLAQTAPGVGIGIAVPNASAVLDLTSTNQGLLVPRLTQAQRQGIANPAVGLLVFQRDGGQPGFWYYGASGGWTFFNPSADNLGNHTASQNLNLQGNALVGTGASIGTTVGLGVRADGGLNLGQNTVGNNVFLGYQAGQATAYNASTKAGGTNQFSGYQSGQRNTTGAENQFAGYQSGYSNTTGSDNQFSGLQSGYSNTEGDDNYFSGLQSGYSNTTGGTNHFSGYQSGRFNTTGSGNHFSGFQSGYRNTTGSQNYFSGNSSGLLNLTGTYNQFTGNGTGINNTTGSNNQFSGYQSGFTNRGGSNNQFGGYQSGHSNTTGSNNHFDGYQSGYYNTTGNGSHFSGYQSGYSNTTGTRNQFVGYQSGQSNTTGSDNLFSGYQSGSQNTTGQNNTFSGSNSGYNNTTGSENIFSGFFSGGSNTTGYDNVFVGVSSGFSSSTGRNNVFYGAYSGENYTTGSNNTALGYAAGAITGGGNISNATAIGYQAKVSQSNSLVLGGTGQYAVQVGIGTTAPDVPLDVQSQGDANVGSFAFYALASNGQPRTGGASGYLNDISIRARGRVVALEFNATSDARLKTVLGRSNPAADLALLRQLRITDYQLRDRAQFGERRFKKVIAQEVEQVFPQAVSRQNGFLPDIYAVPTAAQPQGDSLLALTLPAGLPEAAHAGQRLRLVGPAGEVLARVARPAAAGTRTLVVRGVPAAAASQLFVFGLEHADVRAVDYEALAMLNVSATQELARHLAALEAANAALRQQAAATAGFEQRLRALEAAGAQAASR